MDDNIPHQYYYIYTLSDNGKVFYVGMSHKIEDRYKFHCGGGDLATFKYIHVMRKQNKLPELEIINIAPNKNYAMAIECSLIYYFVSIGNKLCNSECNPIHNQIILPFPSLNNVIFKRRKKHYYKPIVEAAKYRHKKRIKYYEQ